MENSEGDHPKEIARKGDSQQPKKMSQHAEYNQLLFIVFVTEITTQKYPDQLQTRHKWESDTRISKWII